MAKAEKPIEKVAKSFKSIATSMMDMKDSISMMDTVKLDKANTFFETIRDIAMPPTGITTQDVVGEVAKGIREEVNRSLVKTEKLVDTLEAIKKQNKSLEAKIDDAKSGGGGGASAEFMLARFESLEKKLKTLFTETFGTGIAVTGSVKVTNSDDFKD